MDAAIQHFVSQLGHIPALAVYGFILVWLATESCGIPLPNELVLLASGSIAAQRGSSLSPVLLALLATIASLAGASAAYELGKRGGRAAVLRFGRRFGLDGARLDAVEGWFQRTGPLAIAVSRITPFVRTYASFPAGVLELPYPAFLIATAIGSLVWCSVMVTLGFILGKDYIIALHLIERYTIPAIVVLVVLVAGYIWLHNRLAHVGTANARGSTKGSTKGSAKGPANAKDASSKSPSAARRRANRHAARKLR